jgi:hypothetical protein
MKYQSKNPSNSCIYIHHRSKKPVKFSYPNKKSPFRIVFRTFFALWIFLNMFLAIPNLILFSIYRGEIQEEILNIMTFPFILIVLHLFFIPLISTFILIKNDKLLSYMPEINRKLSLIPFGTHNYKKITKLNSTIFEIPIFYNVFLDYKATKEFSKYLIKVEITEHDFKVIKKNVFNKKQKTTQQDNIWKAKFIFSRIPKTGHLEMFFC